MLRNSLFRGVKLTKNSSFNTHKYSGYDTGFDARQNLFSSDVRGFDKNVIMFNADMSSTVHIDNREKCILIFGKDPTQELDYTKLTTEKTCAKNLSEEQKKFCLSLSYNGMNSYLLVKGVLNNSEKKF